MSQIFVVWDPISESEETGRSFEAESISDALWEYFKGDTVGRFEGRYNGPGIQLFVKEPGGRIEKHAISAELTNGPKDWKKH